MARPRWKKAWKRITILQKILGVASAIIMILGFFGITKYSELLQRAKSDAVARVTGKQASVAASDEASLAPAPDPLSIPASPIADGRTYHVTLQPQDMTSHRWAIGDPATRVFHSPGDKTKWTEVSVIRSPHFQNLELRMRDHNGDIERVEVPAGGVKRGRKIDVATNAFALTATIRKVRLRDDPDPSKPFSGKVFESVSLDVSVSGK